MKIVFLDADTMGNIPQVAALRQWGELTLYPSTTPTQTLSRIHQADIVLTNKVVLDRTILEQAPQLRLICVTATGTNNVDTVFAEKRGILVKNAIGYAVESVAQLTFAVLLELIQQTRYFDSYVKSGTYSANATFTHLGHEFWLLSGKRLGIIGLGNIGRGVAHIAEAFGMEVVYASASGNQRPEKYTCLSIEALLQTSDVVSIHAPLNEHTRHLIDYAKLKTMKPTAILLNTGRGGIVVEADLARAIDENLIYGAATDVFEKEPVPADNPLLHVKNTSRLLLTPHIAWAARETREKLMNMILQHIQNFVQEQSQQ